MLPAEALLLRVRFDYALPADEDAPELGSASAHWRGIVARMPLPRASLFARLRP